MGPENKEFPTSRLNKAPDNFWAILVLVKKFLKVEKPTNKVSTFCWRKFAN